MPCVISTETYTQLRENEKKNKEDENYSHIIFNIKKKNLVKPSFARKALRYKLDRGRRIYIKEQEKGSIIINKRKRI